MDDKVKNCILDFISNIKMPEYEEIFSTDIVMWAVKSAYGDAKRTMQGISCFSEEKDAALDEIGEGILEYFTVLEPATSQEEFDVLHDKQKKDHFMNHMFHGYDMDRTMLRILMLPLTLSMIL